MNAENDEPRLPSTEDEPEEEPSADVEPPTTTETEEIDSEAIIQKNEKEAAPRLPEDFYYSAEKINAKPTTTNDQIFPLNTLSMLYVDEKRSKH